MKIKECIEYLEQKKEIIKVYHMTKEIEQKEIHDIRYDSRKVGNDDIFVCIKGYVTDGHQYGNIAIEQGAALLIAEEIEALDMESKIPVLVVKNTRKVLAMLADVYFDHPSKKLQIVGITATNGKTTTAFMLHSIIEQTEMNPGIVGTVMVQYNEYKESSVLTSPESYEMHRHLANMVEGKVDFVSTEVSSSAMELYRAEGIAYDIVAMNNIGREHIELHGSFEAYFAAKARLIREAKKEAIAVLNMDDPYIRPLIKETKAKVVTYSLEDEEANILATDIDISTGRAVFQVKVQNSFEVKGKLIEKQSFTVALQTPGFHSVVNALSAISIALSANIPVEHIKAGIESFRGVERRFEIVYEDRFIIADDHFANNVNIEMTLKTLAMMEYNRVKLVYGIRGSRGVTLINEVVETLEKWKDKLQLTEMIATSSISDVSTKDIVKEEEYVAFMKGMKNIGVDVQYFDELKDAIEESMKDVKKGDVILLAGCQGMDYGAYYALHHLAKQDEENKEQILAPLSTRVAGVYHE